MARKTRHRISYVLPLAKSQGGHRLGINGLAVDKGESILYSGGRDGVICAWNLNFDLEGRDNIQGNISAASKDTKASKPTTFRQQVQAHTHWINDIVLASRDQVVVSASSDSSVKVWRPHAGDAITPQAIGLHSDYVKCLAAPKGSNNWVASGGLDKKVYLWDLNGAGERLRIDVAADENAHKGSVYALEVGGSILASGGPDSIVRIWDPRSGRRITKFVGHTDNIRDILINEDGDLIMTASSDATVKVWSLTAGRCMNTLTMHADSVWALYSDHPQLSLFYSSDRSGLVAKTDVRGCGDMDEGLSVAICQEHGGVNSVINAGDFVWTTTSSSSINRWRDIDTEAGVHLPEPQKAHRFSIASRSKYTFRPRSPTQHSMNGTTRPKISMKSVLRISNTALFPYSQSRDIDTLTLNSVQGLKKPSESVLELDTTFAPCRSAPEESIEGQYGLIKHIMLNDRRRVLTLDTAGEVILWDLMKCIPIQSFGNRHLDDVAQEINTMESVSNWCTVDTRTGSLTCILDENYCFDAEVYMDELDLSDDFEFREDQRINLGKWILRYLFSELIDEEIKRDEVYRKNLLSIKDKRNRPQRPNAPSPIVISPNTFTAPNGQPYAPMSPTTPRATNGTFLLPPTPGLSINSAPPGVVPPTPSLHTSHPLPTNTEAGLGTSNRLSMQNQSRSSLDKASDYFSVRTQTRSATTPGGDGAQNPKTPGEGGGEASDGDKDSPFNSLFGKKFRLSFGSKRLSKTTTADSQKSPVVDDKADDSDARSVKEHDALFESNFLGAIQRIRHGYEEQLQKQPSQLASAIKPSLPNETPVLRPPTSTIILIQEEQPSSGGVVDLFEGTVGSLGKKADTLEQVAPMWLADVLLRDQLPLKEIVKVSFILEPYEDLLPSIASVDGNNRLNANRMLRARKVLSYIAERIEQPSQDETSNLLRPEEYLELYCQNQRIPPTMTLATIRAHIWKGGGDVVLLYKANGRKKILPRKRNSVGEAAAGGSGGPKTTAPSAAARAGQARNSTS